MAYMEIVFMQGENAEEVLTILEAQGEESAMEFLLQWENGDDNGEIYDQNPGGSCDSVYQRGDYIMTYNLSLGYIGLCKIINGENL